MQISEEEFLAHHGVKGMKWGVRKDRGLSKRQSSISKGLKTVSSIGRGIKRFGSDTSKKVNKAKKTYEKMQRDRTFKKMAKDKVRADREYTKMMNSKEAREGRKIALTTHDPQVLAKHQHLLTDSELKGRIDRLNMEEQVNKMARAKRANGWNEFKKKADWAMNSPAGKAALNTGQKLVEKKLGIDGGQAKAFEKAAKDAAEAANAFKRQRDEATSAAQRYKSQRDAAVNSAQQRNSTKSSYNTDGSKYKPPRQLPPPEGHTILQSSPNKKKKNSGRNQVK